MRKWCCRAAQRVFHQQVASGVQVIRVYGKAAMTGPVLTAPALPRSRGRGVALDSAPVQDAPWCDLAQGRAHGLGCPAEERETPPGGALCASPTAGILLGRRR